jgi:hypothetical protein
VFLGGVGGVEVDMLITMGEQGIADMIVGSIPDDSACTGVVSREKQGPGDTISCPGSMYV